MLIVRLDLPVTKILQFPVYDALFPVQVICTAGPADVRATLTCLVTRLQKYCNTNIAPPTVMKVGILFPVCPLQ